MIVVHTLGKSLDILSRDCGARARRETENLWRRTDLLLQMNNTEASVSREKEAESQGSASHGEFNRRTEW